MAEIEDAGTGQETHVRHGGCCMGLAPWQGCLTAHGADGKPHSLHVEGGRLMLGNGKQTTLFTFAVSGPGMVTLAVPDKRGVRTAGNTLTLAEGLADSLVVESADDGRVRLHTAEGLFLLASGPGEPVELTPDAARATAFTLARPAPASNDRGVRARWEAEEGFPHDERHSTHLWIYHRAAEWIMGKERLGSGPNMAATFDEHERAALRPFLTDSNFTNALEQGIHDADNSGYTDPETSGFVFSAHFWHPERNVGGWWGRGRPGENAFEYGARYFRESLDEHDPVQSGKKLGLAIHYLTDLTQPMHCGMYPNVPNVPEAVMLMKLASRAAPEDLPNLFDTSPLANLGNGRHETYEKWALRVQDGWKLTAEDLNLFDIPVVRGPVRDPMHPAEDYWRKAATEALAVYRRWVNQSRDPKSRTPISALSPRFGPAPEFADAEWGTDACKMVKLAQRLVINLLLTWGANSRVAAPFRQLPVGHDIALLSDELIIMPARAGENDEAVYLSTLGTEESHFWALDVVLDANGKPLSDGEWPTSHFIYRLRNRTTARCMVAGDAYPANVDHYVYHQDPADPPGSGGPDRLNAHWVFVFSGDKTRAKDGSVHRCYRIRDLKHGKWLGRSRQPGGHGPLNHGEYEQAADFMLVPRRQLV